VTRRNPETIATNDFRRRLEARGGYTVKVSDTFTRGIPDLQVTLGRLVAVEMKVGSRVYGHTESYKALGLSGAQDQRIREICRRAPKCACVVTAWHGEFTLWVPVRAELQGQGAEMYQCEAEGIEAILTWLS
jgi:hypothetical protein